MMEKQPFSLSESLLCTPLLSLASIEEIAYTSMKMLPRTIYKQVQNIELKVENFATTKILKELNIDNKYDLLGLYSGVPLHEKKLINKPTIIDTIYLYRGPLIKYTRVSCDSINSVICSVLIQEVGHHLGLEPHKIGPPFMIS
jgi:predicted Zn-dependent protease with MMP-like domain